MTLDRHFSPGSRRLQGAAMRPNNRPVFTPMLVSSIWPEVNGSLHSGPVKMSRSAGMTRPADWNAGVS